MLSVLIIILYCMDIKYLTMLLNELDCSLLGRSQDTCILLK